MPHMLSFRNESFCLPKCIKTKRMCVLCVLQTATLTVGDYCDTEVAVRYGKMIGNYTCAAKTTQVLQDRLVKHFGVKFYIQ